MTAVKRPFFCTFPSEEDAAVPQEMQCYRSKYGISWKNAKNGLWMGYSFQIIGC